MVSGDPPLVPPEEGHWEHLIAVVPEGVLIVSAEGVIRAANAEAEKVFGASPGGLVGRSVEALVPPSVRPAHQALRRAFDAHPKPRAMGAGGTIAGVRLDGTALRLEIALSPLPANAPGVTLALIRDVSIREAASEALRAATRAAEDATRAKSRFLAAMSHEIRTPMNAVIGVTELLLDTRLDTHQRELLEVLRHSGEGLLALLDEILDFSKVEAGQTVLTKRPFDAVESLEGLLALLAPRAESRGLELVCRIATEVPTLLLGDEQRFSQILLNLVGNALKFTEQGGVVVTLEPSPRGEDGRSTDEHGAWHGVVTVRDTGIGVPASELASLFRAFTQVDSPAGRRERGTGLGLAISRRLSLLMGGTIGVESAGLPGQGSTFRFTFAAELPSVHPPAPTRMPAEVLRAGSALLLAERPLAAEVLEEQLRSWGMIVHVATDLEAARRHFASGGRPTVVVAVAPSRSADPIASITELQAGWRASGGPGALPVVLLCSAKQRAALDGLAVSLHGQNVSAVLASPPRTRLLWRALAAALGDSIAPLSSPAAPMRRRLPLRILIVEDDEVNQMVLRGMLMGLGLRAETVATGAAALEETHRRDFDLVLMDMQLPGMDGVEATRLMRARDRAEGRHPPRIVAVTANAFSEDRERCFAAGMDDFLAKPLRKAELLAVLVETEQGLSVERRPNRAAAPSAPPPPPPVDGALLDPAALAELVDSLGGDPQSLDEMLDTLLMNASALVTSIEQAHAASAWEELRRSAHSLKSNARTFGLGPLATMSMAIEEMARGEPGAASSSRVGELGALFDRSRAALIAHVRGRAVRAD